MNNTYLNNLNNEHDKGLSVRRMNKKYRWIAIGILLLLVIFSVIFATKTVTAKREGYRVKEVTCVQIQKGDTLWSIANTYLSDEYRDVNEYIREIKYSNGLESDTIHAGNYIIVPYYVDDIR